MTRIIVLLAIGLVAYSAYFLANEHVAIATDSASLDAPIIEVLMRNNLDTDDPSEVAVRTHLYQPGWAAPTHYHNSDLFIFVLEGEFEVTMEQSGTVVYSSGEALRMEPGTVMDARNPSDLNSLKIVVFQVGHIDDPFVVPTQWDE